MNNNQSAYQFVLVHGAWHGAWCWEYVAMNLNALGHSATTPTQRGLGERADEITMTITLSDFVDDLVEHLIETNQRDAILVGHSFGGNAISGAADRVPERIAGLVYLDALVLKGGEAPFDRLPPALAEERLQLARESSGGISLPPPPATSFGVLDKSDGEWLEQRLTPHPVSTYTSRLELSNPLTNGIDATYVVCTDPIYEPLESTRTRVRELGWPMREIATGHNAMVTEPALLTEMLLTIAAGE